MRIDEIRRQRSKSLQPITHSFNVVINTFRKRWKNLLGNKRKILSRFSNLVQLV